MAEYIDRTELEPDTEWSEYYDDFISYSQSQINSLPTADVIERTEYEYLKKENHELAIKYDNAMNMVINEQENVTRLRSQIDKAKKQITDSMNEHLASDGTPIDEYAYCYLNVLEILEENIGE